MSLEAKKGLIIGVSVIVLLGFILSVFFLIAPFSRTHPNVIIIVVDALRADHLSFNDYHPQYYPNISQNIDNLAFEGINFKRAFCHVSWTLPSIITMFTSLYPSVHGVTKLAQLPNDFTTQAEIFKRNNYKTGGFVSGGYVKSEFGLDQGFDIYIDKYDTITNITGKALNWLDKNKSEKFFIYMHCLETHVPYGPPDEYKISNGYTWDHRWVGSIRFNDKYEMKERTEISTKKGFLEKVIELYDGEIKYVDTELGKFFKQLKELNLYDNTLIILTSDHGEEFRDHGGWSHVGLYEEAIHVPLIMKLPGKYRKYNNKIINTLAGHIDLMPTINDIVGLSFNDYPIQGQSLLPIIKGKEHNNKMIFLERNVLLGLRTAEYKFIIDQRKKDYHELYNIKEDPGERFNLLSNPSEEAVSIKNDMETKLRLIMNENKYLALRLKIEKMKTYDTEDIKRLKELEKDLKSLGYIK